ncbi:unnamed protein product [Microthlaspi erraticum]|uniref:Expansin n=1 Tax=Microthlaspi erraticum TaxID=1685480 RepID=A0A6D2L2G0_9BRAS|nr:unnamed protein product [Microthlaspi erraticum]
MMYTQVLMIVVAIWFAPIIYGQEAEAPATGDVADAPGTDSFKNGGWYEDARATYYGDMQGGETRQGACGYTDTFRQGYGLYTTALSTPLFNDGYTCGACYEIMCANTPQACLPGSIKVTATNSCPPGSTGGWCDPPQKHFDLTLPMFIKIAKQIAGVVPVRYRRIPCVKRGGVRFETTGNPNFLMILPYNVGGAGDIKAVQIKGNKTGWMAMSKNWGQHWTTNVMLTGQQLSFRVTTSDGVTKDFINVAPKTWGFGQTFNGRINF